MLYPSCSSWTQSEKLIETGIYKHMTIWTAFLVANHAKEGGYVRAGDGWIRKKGDRSVCNYVPTLSQEAHEPHPAGGCELQAAASQLLALL